MSIYQEKVLPYLVDLVCSSKSASKQRKKVVPYAEGVVLEVGIGSGLNLPFYDESKVSQIWGLDPSEELSAIAKETAKEQNLDVKFISGGAEEIPLPDNYFDTALVTYTMCTIPEVIRANIEIKRVLKDTGKLIFCEHGIAPDVNIAKWQSRIDPIWGKLSGGCHLNRDIPSILEDSGYKIIELDQMYLPNTPKVAGYNYWGFAVGIN